MNNSEEETPKTDVSRSETFKSVIVKGYTSRLHPEEIRLMIGSYRAEWQNPTLQKVLETELVFERDTFLMFIRDMNDIVKWLGERPIVIKDDEAKKKALKTIVKGEFSKDEILKELWADD